MLHIRMHRIFPKWRTIFWMGILGSQIELAREFLVFQLDNLPLDLRITCLRL